MSFSLWLPAAGTAIASTLLTLGLVFVLKRRGLVDVPNERSLHVAPTPRGGGWAILLALALGCLSVGVDRSQLAAASPILGGTVLLLAISARDDKKPLSPLPRFGTQIVAVTAGMVALPGGTFQGLLPGWVDASVTAFGWLWFVNLFNFMDGMDGLAGGEALAIAIGLFFVSPDLAPWALVLAAAVLGFLIWNWSPARLFLGDVGSIPLGYLLGAMLLSTAQRGHWAAALILPSYFLADATLTLLRRISRREKIWQAHRTHFYQRAVQAGRTHAQVATRVMVANLALVVCACTLAGVQPLIALGVAALVVTALLMWMSRASVAA